jgi:hypothetical protein
MRLFDGWSDIPQLLPEKPLRGTTVERKTINPNRSIISSWKQWYYFRR